jgi:hypothetical protein
MNVKRLIVLLALLLVAGLTGACSQLTGQSTGNKMIEPGDKIGDFLITTGVEGQFTYGFNIECSDMSEKNTYSCNATVGKAINVSTGINDSTGKGNLDQIWTNSKYQMFINDLPVDLQAFGIINYTHPAVGEIRFANVVIIASKPGEITVKDSGVFDNGDPFASTSTYVFSNP